MAAKKLGTEDAKQALLKAVMNGLSLDQACLQATRSRGWYEATRAKDPQWRAQMDRAKLARGINTGLSAERLAEARAVDPLDSETIEYPAFAEAYLSHRVFPHMMNVVDLIEGRDPSWLPTGVDYEPGERDMIMVNMPPSHGKSTSITIDYAVYRIVKDPSVRIVIISKSQAMAKKMLLAIKNRLTHPQYSKLISTFAPIGGYEANSDAWTTEMIYVGGDRDVEQKDPTVQALGIRGHLYGARADLIIMDDCVDMTNYLDYDRQIDWIQGEVVSRIEEGGSLLVVGTRLAPKDLYLELRDPARYPEDVSPWTYLSMPAVLEYDDDPTKWVTLWPRSNVPEAGDRKALPDAEGLYPKWDGPRLLKKRARLAPHVWARVYQQQQVAEDSIFKSADIRGCIQGSRNAGLIQGGMYGNRPEGMAGLIVVAGLDPATTGFTAATVMAIDPRGFKRYLLDVKNKANLHPDELRSLMFDLTDKYQITEWVIEKNGFQGFLAFDREVTTYMSSRGCTIRPHFTGANKSDPDFGVAAMSALFKGWEDGNNQIELPSPHASEGVKALIEQLSTWAPNAPKQQKTDAVMSLWFAELACLEKVRAMSTYARSHARNPFLTAYDRSRQIVVDAAAMREMWKAV